MRLKLGLRGRLIVVIDDRLFGACVDVDIIGHRMSMGDYSINGLPPFGAKDANLRLLRIWRQHLPLPK